ncbi:MAG: MerR family transcriptional regulator [bacterium]
MNNIYTVTEAATKLGISAKTLRRWEETDRFHSSRTLGGQRRYSTEDLQILDAISHNIIPSDQELLTTTQSAALAGVSEATINRWEQTGKIHTFVTSSGTYFIKSHLLTKLNSLKSSEPTLTPTLQSLQPLQAPAAQSRELVSPSLIHDFQLLALNLFASISIIMGYHILTYKPAQITPVASNPIARVETNVDPKVELLKNMVDSSGNLSTAGMMRITGQLTTSNFVLSPISRPLTPVAGTLYFDAGSQTLELYTGTSWQIISPLTLSPAPSTSARPKSSLTPLR